LWGLTKATDEELSALQNLLKELIDQAMQTENSSVRRLTLNIIKRLEMNEVDLRTDFLDFCFEHMVSIEEFPGIQTLCMKLAYRMCTFYPELMDELKRTLEAMEIDYYKPAVKCLRSRILSGKYQYVRLKLNK
jgi:Zn finger protein HypA/HybF involved in hydrogenase expression